MIIIPIPKPVTSQVKNVNKCKNDKERNGIICQKQ